MVIQNTGSGGSPSGSDSSAGTTTVDRKSSDDRSDSDTRSKSAGSGRESSRSDGQSRGAPAKAGENRSDRQLDQIAHQVKDSARSFATHQKNRAADRLGGVAKALKQTGRHIAEEGEETLGNRVSQTAEQLDRFSADLRQKDVDSMLHATRDLVSRHPVVLFTVAIVGGLALAQFLKSAAEKGDDGRGDTDYGLPPSEEGADQASRSAQAGGGTV